MPAEWMVTKYKNNKRNHFRRHPLLSPASALKGEAEKCISCMRDE
jgi:hypothetical protein